MTTDKRDPDEFEAAYRERIAQGQVRWHPGAYQDFEMRAFLERTIADWGAERSSYRVLDLGCGTGQVSLFMAAHGAQVTGIDGSPSAIAYARQAAEQHRLAVDFRVGDLCEMALGDYDVIIDCCFYHCVVSIADRERMFRKLHNALRAGGELWSETMIGVPAVRSGDGFVLDEEGVFWKALPNPSAGGPGMTQGGKMLSPIRRIWPSVETFNNELRSAGFRIISQEEEAPHDEYSVSMVRTRAANG